MLELEILASSEILDALVGPGLDRLHPGEKLADEIRIAEFLEGVNRYGRDAGCRFDYRLSYATPQDYLDARSRFEQYLYPAAKMIRIRP